MLFQHSILQTTMPESTNKTQLKPRLANAGDAGLGVGGDERLELRQLDLAGAADAAEQPAGDIVPEKHAQDVLQVRLRAQHRLRKSDVHVCNMDIVFGEFLL